MKVKVRNKVYDGEKEPIMVILEPGDKENIKRMPAELTKYCMYPDHLDPEEIKEWMADGEVKRDLTDYSLDLTCGACPEQYDVYKGEERVAYFRLRHGYFYAACPWVGGETVYEAHPKGDGCFTADEQEYYLTKALEAVYDYYQKEKE